MTTKLRIIRLLVYEGIPAAVEHGFERRAVNGQVVYDTGKITEAILSRSYFEEDGLPIVEEKDNGR